MHPIRLAAALAAALFISLIATNVFASPPSGCRANCSDTETTAVAVAGALAASDAEATAASGAVAGSSATGEVGVEVVTNAPAPDVKGAANELSHRAESAPPATASSSANVPGCGDTTGVSAQTGVAGGGLATITEACRASRYAHAEATLTQNGYGRRAAAVRVAYWVGFLPRLVLHVVSFGALN